MYIKTDHNQLVDFEYLEFPPDVETLEYDLPQLTVFNEQVKPVVDNQLNREGKKSLEGTSYEGYIPRGGQYGVRYTRDFKLSGSRIQKEVTRVFLGLYRVVYKYGDKEFSIWFSGDGKKVTYDEVPVDPQREVTIAEKRKTLEAVAANNTGKFITGLVLSIIAAGISIFIAISVMAIGAWVAFGIFTGLSVLFGFLIPSAKRKGKARDEEREKAKKELEDFEALLPAAIQRFKDQKKPLRGIYEKLAGDAKAFESSSNVVNDDDDE
jgi:hypothetical protein